MAGCTVNAVIDHRDRPAGWHTIKSTEISITQILA